MLCGIAPRSRALVWLEKIPVNIAEFGRSISDVVTFRAM
jgi:hypothetical protein